MAVKAKIGVLGASGYTGGELVRILLRHPRANIVLLTAERSAGKAMRDVFQHFSPFALPQLVAIDGLDWANLALDVAFCALPHATTQKVIKELWQSRQRPRLSISRLIFVWQTRWHTRNGTVTNITRPICRRRPSTASLRFTGEKFVTHGSWPTPVATRAAHNCL